MPRTIRIEIRKWLTDARHLVETRVRPDEKRDGWVGKDLPGHLAAYVRIIAAILRTEADVTISPGPCPPLCGCGDYSPP
jgi:hypothetical protein